MIKTLEPKLYLSVIIAGYINKVIEHSISKYTNVAFPRYNWYATKNYSCVELILHSDQGTTYTAHEFQERVKEKNIIETFLESEYALIMFKSNPSSLIWKKSYSIHQVISNPN